VPAIREVDEEPFCLKHLLAEGHASNAGKPVNEQVAAAPLKPVPVAPPIRAHPIRGTRIEQPRKSISKSEEKPMATWSEENTCRACGKAGARIKGGICKKCAKKSDSVAASATNGKRRAGGAKVKKVAHAAVASNADSISITVSPSLIERLWSTLFPDEKKRALEAVLCD